MTREDEVRRWSYRGVFAGLVAVLLVLAVVTAPEVPPTVVMEEIVVEPPRCEVKARFEGRTPDYEIVLLECVRSNPEEETDAER